MVSSCAKPISSFSLINSVNSLFKVIHNLASASLSRLTCQLNSPGSSVVCTWWICATFKQSWDVGITGLFKCLPGVIQDAYKTQYRRKVTAFIGLSCQSTCWPGILNTACRLFWQNSHWAGQVTDYPNLWEGVGNPLGPVVGSVDGEVGGKGKKKEQERSKPSSLCIFKLRVTLENPARCLHWLAAQHTGSWDVHCQCWQLPSWAWPFS